MYPKVSPEQIAAMNKAGVESFACLVNAQFAAQQQLAALNFSAARSALEQSVSYARSLLGAKDAREYASLGAAAAQPALEKAIAYTLVACEIATRAQTEINSFVQGQAGDLNKNIVGYLDQATEHAPAGTDVVIAAVKSALAAGNTVYENISRATHQAAEIAGSQFVGVSAAIKQANKKAA